MKSLRKSFLTLLALTLFGGAGAWAQTGPTKVTQFTTDMLPASWQGDYSHGVTLEDLQALGFEAVDVSVAAAWTGAPNPGDAWLIFKFAGSYPYVQRFMDGMPLQAEDYAMSRGSLYAEVAGGYMYFYTGSPEPAAIELTKSGANQWTLGQTPDYDLELQVEYYEAHALKEIPEGWTVKVNGVAQQTPYQGDSLMIVETDSVTLVPAGNPRRVKSVTLEDPVPPTITIGNVTLNITGCTTWADIITLNPGVIANDEGMIRRESDGWYLSAGGNWVNTSDPYNSTANYSWEAVW